jgi:hypothetical protein
MVLFGSAWFWEPRVSNGSMVPLLKQGEPWNHALGAAMSDRNLTDADVAAIAAAVRDGLAGAMPGGYVDAQSVADHLSVSLDFVYDHAKELGGVRLAPGPKAPLRFVLREIDDRLLDRRDSKPERPSRSRRAREPRADVDLLPYDEKPLPGSRAGRS